MCESSTNFFNDRCHAAVLAGVKGMSQLPEHRQLMPLEIPWNNSRHPPEAGGCDKAYREDLSSSGVDLALGHLQRDWQRYGCVCLGKSSPKRQQQQISCLLLDCRSISLLLSAASFIEQLITACIGTLLHCQHARPPFIHLWPPISNPPLMSVPECWYVGSQPFTGKGPFSKSFFKINF